MGVYKEVLIVVVAVTVGAGLILLIPAAITSRRLWKTMEAKHREVWRDLGEPAPGPMNARQGKQLRAFVKRGRYSELNDPEIEALASRLGRLNTIVDVVFWVALGAVLAAAVATSA